MDSDNLIYIEKENSDDIHIEQENMDKLPIEIKLKIFSNCLEDDSLKVNYSTEILDDKSIIYEYYNNCISENTKQRLAKIGIKLHEFNYETIKNPFSIDYLKDIYTSFNNFNNVCHEKNSSKYKFIHNYYCIIKYDPNKKICKNLEYYLFKYYYDFNIIDRPNVTNYRDKLMYIKLNFIKNMKTLTHCDLCNYYIQNSWIIFTC